MGQDVGEDLDKMRPPIEYKCNECKIEFTNDLDLCTHSLFVHDILRPTCSTDLAAKQYRVLEYLREELQKHEENDFICYIITKKLIDLGAVELPVFNKLVKTEKYIKAEEELNKLYDKYWVCTNKDKHLRPVTLRHEYYKMQCYQCQNKRPSRPKLDDRIIELSDIVKNPNKYTVRVAKTIKELDNEFKYEYDKDIGIHIGCNNPNWKGWSAYYDYEISIIMNSNEKHKEFLQKLHDTELEVSQMDEDLDAIGTYKKHREELKSIPTMTEEEEKAIIEKANSIPYDMIVKHGRFSKENELKG